MPFEQSTFRDRLARVEERIERAVRLCGRKRPDVTLVAVSKKFSAESIREAYDAGAKEFGENYVQEFAEKRNALSQLGGARYHLIGHLQSNKARLACDLFEVIQTIDTPKLMARLNESAREKGRVIEGMFEIKLSDEETKSGVAPEKIGPLLEAAGQYPNLQVSGLMVIPPWSENPEDSRPYFRKLADLGRQYGLPKLSMGMSNDFEVAIEEGATVIRVGTALFGPRPKPGTKPTS